MARGGARAGRPGRGYSNRSDLPGKVLPIKTGPSQQYGQRVAQERSQQVVPLATSPAPTPAAAQQQTWPQPGSLVGLAAPTARPNEPLTAGIASGPGPGPEVMPLAVASDDLANRLRAMYLRFPTPELAALLRELDG